MLKIIDFNTNFVKNIQMKSSIFFFALIFFGFAAAQTDLSKNNRVSPMDSVVVQLQDSLEVEIIYSRPFLKGREFGKNIVPFGQVWRTGANEATVFEINRDVIIEGNKLTAGRYSLYTIPGEKETVIIFNKDWNQWGTKYDQKRDALRVTVPTHESKEPVEQFTIELDQAGAACLVWGKTLFAFHIQPV